MKIAGKSAAPTSSFGSNELSGIRPWISLYGLNVSTRPGPHGACCASSGTSRERRNTRPSRSIGMM